MSLENNVQNLEDYIVLIKKTANTAISNIQTSLSNYALITDIPSLSGYATETWVSQQGYLTSHQDLSAYALLTDIPSLSGYATENWVGQQGFLTSHQDISGKANITDLASVAFSGSYTDLNNTPTIPAAQIQADWSQSDNTALDYIKNKPTIPSGVTVDQTYDPTSTNAQSGVAIASAGFLTSHQSLSGYATENWVNQQGFLTSHQSLSGYATESWVGQQGFLTSHQDLSAYALLTDIPSLTGYATENWVGQQGYLTGITYNDVVNALTYIPQPQSDCVAWLLDNPVFYHLWVHQGTLHTTTVATTSSTPSAGDTVYMLDSNGIATVYSTVTSYDSVNNTITANNTTFTYKNETKSGSTTQQLYASNNLAGEPLKLPYVSLTDLNTRVSKSGDTMTGTLKITGITSDGQLRLEQGNYGLIFRNDGSSFWWLLTNSGNAAGSYNSLRPFTMNLSTGNITVNAPSVNNISTQVATTQFVHQIIRTGDVGCAANSETSVTFSGTFPDANVRVAMIRRAGASATGATYLPFMRGNPTASGFKVYNPTSSSITIQYIAKWAGS